MIRSGVAVKSGKEYEHLFPKANRQTEVIKTSAEVEDTLQLIRRIVPETLDQTAAIAKRLKGKTLEDTCENIWHFVFDHIKYEKDEAGKEQVRSPARTWDNRHKGVDCDCMTTFISSILMNLNIAHKSRIAMYDFGRGWQHIYPIVPKSGSLNSPLRDRDDYIVMDCVKYAYDDEEPYKQIKDTDMKLEYLNGTDDEVEGVYEMPQTTDIQDLAATMEDEAELGKLGQWLKKSVKKVGTAAKKGLRVVNRFANPGTVLLRNGFLLAMKVNFMKVASKLRYAYLTDEQASAKGMNIAALNHVRKVKEKAESIYYQAGGKKANLKKAILGGKGNKDRAVPMNGLEGLEEEYADPEEYQILNEDQLMGELGDPATGAALAAASATIAALAGALGKVKGLFKSGSKEKKNFESEGGDGQADITNITNDSSMTITDDEPREEGTNPKASLQKNGAASTGKQGFFANSMNWIKENPVPSLLGAVVIGGVVYYLLKKKNPTTGTKSPAALNGIKHRKAKKHKRPRIQAITL